MIFSSESKSEGSNSTSRRIVFIFFRASSNFAFGMIILRRCFELCLECEEKLCPVLALLIHAEAFEKFHLIIFCAIDRKRIFGDRKANDAWFFITPCDEKYFGDDDKDTKRKFRSQIEKAIMAAAIMMDNQYHETVFGWYSNSGASQLISNDAMGSV